MGDKLDKGIRAYSRGQDIASGSDSPRDSRALLIVTILYLVALLSMPLEDVAGILWFGVYPILASAVLGKSFNGIFLKSLVVLPLILLIGIFNPILDRAPGSDIGPLHLTHGWVTFISITLRGIYAVQALLILTECCGFIGMCRAMKRLFVPAFLTTQLEMVYRYAGVLMLEIQQMRRARVARGYGKRDMNLRMWGRMTGQLFIRSIDRASRIHNAMLCRGFHGTMPDYDSSPRRWETADTVFLIVSLALFAMLRFYNPCNFFTAR